MLPALLTGLLTAAPAPLPPELRMRRALQAELEAFVAESGAPGASLAVALADGRVLAFAAGLADLEARTPMQSSHLLLSGSIGKSCAAALVLGLAAEGRLDLEDPLSRHLGDLAWISRLPNGTRLRVRHLLEHSSGLPEYVEQPALWEAVRRDPDRVWTPEARLAFVEGMAPRCAPGEGFAYADSNYILLGLLLERLMGQPYATLLETRLFRPLGLRDTRLAEARVIPGLASGYSALGAPFKLPAKTASQGRYVFNPQMEWAGGGLVGSASDLARWGRALYGGEVLPKAWRTRMLQPAPHSGVLPGGARYGLGAFVWETPEGPMYGHSGFAPGYNSILVHSPARGATVALLCNSDTAMRGAGRVPFEAAARFLRALGGAPAPQ